MIETTTAPDEARRYAEAVWWLVAFYVIAHGRPPKHVWYLLVDGDGGY